MDSRCDGKRTNANVEVDRLSSLPDDLIHKILSFLRIKHVVATSVLSSRWRFIWTSMPYLNFFSEDFPYKFSEVVSNVLSGRNDQVEVVSLMLTLDEWVSREFAERILNYAFAHNVQHMSITCVIERKIAFPLSPFRSQSLKHLTLIGSIDRSVGSTWELPALTTLHLGYVRFYAEGEDDDEDEDDDEYYDHDNDEDVEEEEEDDGAVAVDVAAAASATASASDDDNANNIISMCPNLQNLTIDGCKIMGSIGFRICHPELSNLTLKNGYWGTNVVHVVVPRLKNLTIENCDWVRLSAPDLTSFIYRNGRSLKFSTDNLSSLEEVDFCVRRPYDTDAHAIVDRLQQFRNVKSLTLNLETIEVLSSSVELISNQPSPFANLRSLKIYPVNIQLKGQGQKKVAVPNLVRNYLLDGSSSASFTLVTREEIKASETTLVQHLMAELRLKLEREIANDNWDDMERGKEPTGDELLDQKIMRSWFEEETFRDSTSKLQRIEGLLMKLPASNMAKMQLVFDSLCAEAKCVMKKMDRTNSQWRLLGVCSEALAKALW